MIKKRINKLRNKFVKYGIDGYVVPKNDEFFSEYSNKDRLKFISNFTGSAGYAIILKKKSLTKENDETRYSVSLSYKENFINQISKTLIFEFMEINHYDGEAAHDRSYFTSSLGLKLYPWSFDTSYQFIDNDATEEDEGADGKILQISVGYNFSNKTQLTFGFKRADEELEVTERFGLGLRHAFEL